MRALRAAAGLAFARTLPWAALALPAALLPRLLDDPAARAAVLRAGGEELARTAPGAALAEGLALALAGAAAGVVALVAHAGALREREAEGLGTAPLSRAGWALGTFAGGALALVLALAGALALVVASAGPAAVEHRLVREIEVPPLSLVGERDARALELDGADLAGASHLLARLVALPGQGPVVLASLTAERDGGRARSEGRVWARRALAVDLPPGEGPVRVTLARLGSGAGVGLERDGLSALAPARGPVDAELSLLSAGALLLASAAALALALRAHLGGPFALGIAASLWLCALAGAPALAWLPGAELPAALELTGRGVAARGAAPLAALCLCAASLVVAATGARSAREAGP